MTKLSERLRKAMAESGMSQAELARACKVSGPTVSNWLSGKTKALKASTAIAAASALGVDVAWLESGRWAPVMSGNVSATPIGSRRIPLVSYVQAGAMTEVVESYAQGMGADFLLTDLDLGANAFALKIRGDSMRPEFAEGDVVIIDPSVTPHPGDFVVAKNGSNEATFKKYRPRGIDELGQEVFELVPLNDDYPSMRSNVTPIMIIGTMVEHRRYRRR